MTGTGIFCIIVNDFSYRKKLGLIVLFVNKKTLKIGLHCTILPFDLIIGLKIENNEEFLLDLKKVI